VTRPCAARFYRTKNVSQKLLIMSKLNSLKDLLVDELKDLYHAETQLVKALPKMAKAATNPDLKNGFTSHLEQTRGHVTRLEQALRLLGESPKGKTCYAMEGLVKEGGEAIDTDAPDAVKDANLIGAAQRVEHYEIAAYGTVHTYANILGEDEAASLLEETLEEEKETDQKLTQLAEQINVQAAGEGEEEGEDGDEGEESENESEKATVGTRSSSGSRASSGKGRGKARTARA
jgi:ferritin-like metal-binding protein YciE